MMFAKWRQRWRLNQAFRSRGPWVTRFTLAGGQFGGKYHASQDSRLRKFLDAVPRPGRLLELGCLEGGHTLCLAERADEVVAIDARPENLARAKWVAELAGVTNVTFAAGDVESVALDQWGSFDTVFNVGLLYHVGKPWELIHRLGEVAQQMFLWTHVARDEWPLATIGGYRGCRYPEAGGEERLTGLVEWAFWPTRDELRRMLAEAGFVQCTVLHEDLYHGQGPAVTWLVQKEAKA